MDKEILKEINFNIHPQLCNSFLDFTNFLINSNNKLYKPSIENIYITTINLNHNIERKIIYP